jgi:outer membrane protein OmpA-like peptidoglycan-associated protein
MKMHYTLLLSLASVVPLTAQPVDATPKVVESEVRETVDPATGTKTVEETVTETTPGFDPVHGLEIAPRPVQPPPGTTVETTETTTHVGGRVYNTERSVVVVEGRELPYVTIPVLFVKETAELLDAESRAALNQTAGAIIGILKTNPTAVFDIEGHTSTEGATDFNLDLSAKRAQRIYQELTSRYGVPASALSAHGYGESYPQYPNGTEAQLTLDRRVLVVRVK